MSTALNSRMDFDHVVEVTKGGSVIDGPAGVYAPEVTVDLDSDGQMVSLSVNDIHLDPNWELLNGYSGQQGYSGPIMHQSEYVGGRLERDILDRPGLYAVVAVTGMRPHGSAENDDVVGWAVVRRKD